MLLRCSYGKTIEVEEAFVMESPVLKALKSDPTSSIPAVDFPTINSATLKNLVYLFQMGQNLDRHLQETDPVTLFHLIHAANTFKMKSLMYLACNTFASMFHTNPIGEITELIIKVSGSSVTKKRGRDPPTEEDKVLAESKMVDPQGQLKLGSGIVDIIVDYSPKVAPFLISNTARKAARIRDYALSVENGDSFKGAIELFDLLGKDKGLGNVDVDVMVSIVPLLFRILKSPEKDKYTKIRIADVLSNIKNWGAEPKEGAVPVILEFIKSDAEFNLPGLALLANLACDSSARKAMIDCNILSLVEEIARGTTDISIMFVSAKILSTLLHGMTDLHIVQECALRILKRLINWRSETYEAYICNAIKYLIAKGSPVDVTVCDFLVNHTKYFSNNDDNNPRAAIIALESVGYMARWGNDHEIEVHDQTDMLLYHVYYYFFTRARK